MVKLLAVTPGSAGENLRRKEKRYGAAGIPNSSFKALTNSLLCGLRDLRAMLSPLRLF